MHQNIKQLIKKAHIVLSESRGYTASYCPSEVARRVFSESSWRNHMDDVRLVADGLVNKGFLVVLQRDMVIDEQASKAKGPIRLRKK